MRISSESKKSPIGPKEYDYRVVSSSNPIEYWDVEVFKNGTWKYVKLFWSEKEAQNWLNGGVPSYKFKS